MNISCRLSRGSASMKARRVSAGFHRPRRSNQRAPPWPSKAYPYMAITPGGCDGRSYLWRLSASSAVHQGRSCLICAPAAALVARGRNGGSESRPFVGAPGSEQCPPPAEAEGLDQVSAPPV